MKVGVGVSAGSRGFALIAVLCVAGCGQDPEPIDEIPRTAPLPEEKQRPAAGAHARPELVEALRSDLANERHPSDGGGKATVSGPPSVEAGGLGRWTIHYEAGEHGVAVGGQVFLQVSPFWEWSTPQTIDPDGRGYTTVESDAEGVHLEARTLDEQLLGVEISGRALAPGESIRIAYGAGSAGARADRFAEQESRFWIAVDGDGDGVREFLLESPTVDVTAGPAEQLVATLPATLRPGEEGWLTLAVLDAAGNAGTSFSGEITFGETSEAVRLPQRVRFAPQDAGRKRISLRVDAQGLVRIEATGPDGLEAISNPMRVSADAPRVLFGDLHGHSSLSDGTGTPEAYYDYARHVAALDFVSLTDHDHWGIPFLDGQPAFRERIARATQAAHAPPAFVALHGYEWTSWIFGHRHVVYFGTEGPIYSSLDDASDTPQELWERLRGHPALTFSHHSAGGPIATDWTVRPDPELEPLTEVASVHGNSEAADAPAPIHRAIEGNWVRDALDRGYRLGFVGSGDSHDGHPGLTHLASGWGGLAAVFSETNSRDALRSALRARRTYATNGPRILLETRLDGRAMGETVAATELGDEVRLVVDAVGTGALASVDVVRSGVVAASIEPEDRAEVLLAYPVRSLRPGEYLYVRVIQRDGGAAWSSPYFID